MSETSSGAVKLSASFWHRVAATSDLPFGWVNVPHTASDKPSTRSWDTLRLPTSHLAFSDGNIKTADDNPAHYVQMDVTDISAPSREGAYVNGLSLDGARWNLQVCAWWRISYRMSTSANVSSSML